MKNILLFIKTWFFYFLFVGLLFFLGCGMSRPDVKNYPAELTSIEKKLTYQYEYCLYAQSYSKIDLRCNDILTANQKIYFMLHYKTLKDSDKLPKINGSNDMSFDDFFRFIK